MAALLPEAAELGFEMLSGEEAAGVANEQGILSKLGMKIPDSLKTSNLGNPISKFSEGIATGAATALGNLMNEGYYWRVRQGDSQLKKEEAKLKEELEEKMIQFKDPIERRRAQEDFDKKMQMLQKDYENQMNKLQKEYDRQDKILDRKEKNFELTKTDFHDVLNMLKKNVDYAGDRVSKQQAATTLANFMNSLGAVFPKGSGVIESPVYKRMGRSNKGCGIAEHYIRPENFYYEVEPDVVDNKVLIGQRIYRRKKREDNIPESEIAKFRKYGFIL